MIGSNIFYSHISRAADKEQLTNLFFQSEGGKQFINALGCQFFRGRLRRFGRRVWNRFRLNNRNHFFLDRSLFGIAASAKAKDQTSTQQ